MQLTSFLMDHGLSLEEAFHQPRIDMSGGDARDGRRHAAGPVIAARAGEACPPARRARTVFPYAFACRRACCATAQNMGCTEIMSPWGDAVAEDAYARASPVAASAPAPARPHTST